MAHLWYFPRAKTDLAFARVPLKATDSCVTEASGSLPILRVPMCGNNSGCKIFVATNPAVSIHNFCGLATYLYMAQTHTTSFLLDLDFTARQDNFTHFDPNQWSGGAKMGDPLENPPVHPQAELGLSHMWPELGSTPQQWDDERFIPKD